MLGPGKYRLNPYGYQVEMMDAISIPIGYVGVVTVAVRQAGARPASSPVPGEKGVRKDILQPGLYYVNPKEFKVDVLEIGVNQVSLLGKKGGEVITKAQIATQNAAMDELSAAYAGRAEGEAHGLHGASASSEQAACRHRPPRRRARRRRARCVAT